jgi:hypothetical protein
MLRYRIFALALAGVLFCTGEAQAGLALTKTWPDAFGSTITYGYTASTDKFTLSFSTFAQYTPVQGGTVFNPTGTRVYSLTAYIDATGTPLTPSELTTAGDVDSLKVSGTVNGVAGDFFDSTQLDAFTLEPGSTKSNAVFEFEFTQDSGSVGPANGLIGAILSGPENQTPGFSQNFAGSSFDAVQDVFAVPEPSSIILMTGACIGVFTRRPGRLQKKQQKI